MEAKNFRIGNLVHELSGENMVIGVHVIDAVDIVFIQQEHKKHPNTEYYEFIELSKEWLLKCGGKLEPIQEECDEYINLDMNGWTLTADSSNDFTTLTNNNFKPVRYVHELQNLFFAITGQELSIENVM